VVRTIATGLSLPLIELRRFTCFLVERPATSMDTIGRRKGKKRLKGKKKKGGKRGGEPASCYVSAFRYLKLRSLCSVSR